MGELNTQEPAVRARISPTNQALFETIDDYLTWSAYITRFDQFDKLFRQAGGKGVSITFYKAARAKPSEEIEALLKKVTCTDGSTLFEAMRKSALGYKFR